MCDVKGDSSLWINEDKLVSGLFLWQEGYGAFCYSKSQIPAVATYIEKQELHHKKRTFIEVYIKILQDFEIGFDDKYIFKTITD